MEPLQTAHDEDAPLVQLATELLPEAWRDEVRVERLVGALTVHFRDAEGLRHAFDVRPLQSENRAPVSGEHLAFSYQEVDPEVDALAMLDAYRDALRAFAAREEDFRPWMNRAPKLRDDCVPAPEGLRAALLRALPEAWRGEVEAYTTADGFELRFRDAAGMLHGFDGRRVGAEVAAFVRGEQLAFAYAVLDARVDAMNWTEKYREALDGFVAHEGEIMSALRELVAESTESQPASPQQGETDFAPRTDLEPAPDALVELLEARLPPEWRHEVVAYFSSDGFVLRFRDAQGRPHGLEGARIRPGVGALVRGSRMNFAYEPLAAGLDLSVLIIGYTEALRAFAACEDELVALLPPPRVEADLPAPQHREDHEAPVPDALVELVRGMLPEPWRADLGLAIVSEESLIVRARDAAGILHALDVRRLNRNQPCMIRGAALGYSYTRVDPRLDEAATMPLYREVLERFIAREPEILAHFDALNVA